MKVDIRDCQECDRETLQAETGISSGYNFVGRKRGGGGTIFRKVWFCSQCGSYWEKRKNEHDEKVVPK